MPVKIKPNTAPFDPDQLQLVESTVGFISPPLFRKFLEQYNGGVPETNTVELQGGRLKSVVRFFGTTKNSSDGLMYNLETYAERVPDQYLPVAELSGGDVLCIDRTGRVFVWNHELEEDAIAPTSVCENFDALLDMLKPFDPKSVPLSPSQVKKAWINPDFLRRAKGNG